MSTKKRLKLIALVIVTVIVIAMIISAFVCSDSLKITNYELPLDGLTSDIKAVCISDLHGNEYGENNEELIQLIAQTKPDVIFTVGDLIDNNADENNIRELLELLKNLNEIAPVYFSLGNNEADYIKNNGNELSKRITETGTVFLCDNFTQTEINGNTIRIGGTIGHYRNMNWKWKLDYFMQWQIGSTDAPSIVLSHMPENLVYDSCREKWTTDLYISGHTHGGLWRIPGIGGLIAPTQGLFPKYDEGQFLIDERFNMIITSGLSGHGSIPRIFNRPEICVITLTPANLQ